MSQERTPSEPAEVRLGSIILFHEEEPAIPSVAEQARVVADFMLGINDRLGYEVPDRHRFLELGKGNLDAFFNQRTEAEVEEAKRQSVLYDEHLMNRYLLPVEEQLLDVYLNARAQMWGTSHGLPLTWKEWDQIRRRIPVAQNPSIDDVLSTVSQQLQKRAASDHGLRLAEAAIQTEELARPVVNSLSETLKREMFIAERIALPVHSSLPVQLPERIPNWAWHDGLHVMVPGWWELREQGQDAKTRQGGKHTPQSNFAAEEHLRLATQWLLGKNQTAMQQRSSWGEQSLAGLSVPRGFIPDRQAKNYEVLFYLGLPEYDDEEQPKPFGARETVEILQRFGRLHSYLHLGIRCALSSSNGQAIELNEKDLLFFSGLDDAVRKGDLKRIDALSQIDTALKDLRTLSLFVRSKDKKIQTGRFPLFRIEPLSVIADGEIRNLVARVDAGLWARSFYTFDAPSYDVASAVFSIPRNQLIASGFAVWLAANIWRFSNGKKIDLERILREVIPRVKPENAEEWEGHNITWEDLEPDTDMPNYNPDRTKDRRRWVRDQIAKLPITLGKHRIKITLHGNKKAGSSWEEFLASKVSASFSGRGKVLEIPSIALVSRADHKLDADDVRAALQRLGMKQGDFAKQLGVSPALVTRWMKPSDDPRWSDIPAKYLSKIRDLLAL
ncbi:DNA-binding transcriptional regulator [Deinococcus sp. QL22]|uniref:helix-turn-helix domain-containing protein n=1 Tax=Deinococcus sp. QL22 TaxID=2939437 RepID=UPI0020177CF3|nr:hypothetical protein [Deinococcus sp. QL22]UQN10834.1 hypothetical protein M1R55_31575 [Deinococcus sp. QL22]